MGDTPAIGADAASPVESGPKTRHDVPSRSTGRSSTRPESIRRPLVLLATVGLLVATLAVAFTVASGVPSSGLTAGVAAMSGWSTTPLNLLNGVTHVSPSLVKNGHTARGDATTGHLQNTSEPRLLKGAHTSEFWSTGQPVMLLAPWSTAGYNSGTLLFSEPAETAVHIHLVAVYEDTSANDVVADGVAAYFFVDPTHVGNWSMPFVGLGPEVNSTNQHIDSEGNQIFPYSYSPYVIVQWDPANGYSAGFNVYLVHPEPSGKVTYLSIQAAGQLGTTNYEYPAVGEEFDFNASYSTSTNVVTASVAVPSVPNASFSLKFSLGQFGFTPSFSPSASYYFGIAGNSGWSDSGAVGASWGALRLSASGSTPSTAAGITPAGSILEYGTPIASPRDALRLGWTR
jgi:hypothetical protein